MTENKLNLVLIINGCRENNPKSQRKLYDHYFGFGMNVALRYARNRQEALEILNDSFLKVFKNLDKFDSEYPFQPWFRKIISRTAIDYYRKNQNAYRSVDLTQINEPIDTEFELPEITPNDDMLPTIQALSPRYRAVFNLYVMEGYKHSEIAEMLNINIATSKSNLFRAKVKLREAWAKKNIKKVLKNNI